MLIVVERRETFHYYYPMGVHPPGDLTVTLRTKDRHLKELLLTEMAANYFAVYSILPGHLREEVLGIDPALPIKRISPIDCRIASRRFQKDSRLAS